MPKRSAEQKIERYKNKIRRLEDKCTKRRNRVIIYTDSSDADNDPGDDIVLSVPEDIEEPEFCVESHETEIQLNDETCQEGQTGQPASSTEEPVVELEADFISALGETTKESPSYGEKIHQDLAQRWLPILRKGLSKDIKDKIIQEYCIPENCKLLRGPTLNEEIYSASSEIARCRDKKLEANQTQLGLGVTAINRAMTMLLTGTEDRQNKVQVIKLLSDGCKILTDLHYIETQARVKLLTPGLDKTFNTLIQNGERDETLYGSKLSEKIKTSKTIEKQALQIKKGVSAVARTTTSSFQRLPPTTPRSFAPRSSGNWTAPPRYQAPNRGGRGIQRSAQPPRRAPPSATSTFPNKPTYQYNNKQRITRQ